MKTAISEIRETLKSTLVSLLFFSTIFACRQIIAQNGIVWQRHVIDSSLSGADGVRLRDVNADGLMDIATGWEESGYTKIYLHPGYEAVQKSWPSVVVGQTPSVEDAVFSNVNDDTAIDVVSCTEGKNQKIYIHWAPQNSGSYAEAVAWSREVLPASDGLMQWMFATTFQLDGLNGVDIIAGAKGENAGIGWFQSPAVPAELDRWVWRPMSAAGWIMSLLSKDMDGDGDLDIVVSDRRGNLQGVRWLENPGAIEQQILQWNNHFVGARDVEVMFMDRGDLDGDGLEDIVATERTNQKIIYLRRLDNTGLRWESHSIDIPTNAGKAKAVKIGDIDCDGKSDIVLSTNTLKVQDKVGLLWLSFTNETTDPHWEWHELSGPVGYKFDRIELIDLDGDRDLDVLTCEENYGADSKGLGVIWYENPENKCN